MANPPLPQPASIFDLEGDGGPASPALSTTTGAGDSIFDTLEEAATQPTKAPKTPEQKSESNTLWGNAKAETVLGELGAGLQSGVRGVLATPPALIGLGASYYDEALGESYLEWSRQIAEGGAQRGIAKIEDLTMSPVSWARYVAGVTGEAVPFILSIAGGAGAGSMLAGLLRKKGVGAATKSAILSSAPAFGGAFTTAAAIETGATARELFEATGEVKPSVCRGRLCQRSARVTLSHGSIPSVWSDDRAGERSVRATPWHLG
jgi:hypothetical protein